MAEYRTLFELYQRSVQQYSDRPLLGQKKNGAWQWISYREFSEQVERTRSALLNLGLAAGDRVALIANNRPEWAVIAYAAFTIKGVLVPMYEAQQDKDWLFILDDCQAKCLFVSDVNIAKRVTSFSDKLPALKHIISLGTSAAPSTLLWNDVLRDASGPTPQVMPEPADVAEIIYTSGTTGNPKGVVLSHLNIASNVTAFQPLFDIGETDRSLSFLPWAHAFGQVAELHMLISKGSAIACAESVDKIVSNLSEIKPTVLISVPRIFNRIYDGVHKKMQDETPLKRKLFQKALSVASQRAALREKNQREGWLELQHAVFERLVFRKIRERFGGALRFAVSGGAALSTEVGQFIDNLGIAVYEGYGLTEASPVIAVNTPAASRRGSVGKALANVEVRIDEKTEDGHLQQEILVKGPNVMVGYYNALEETRQIISEDGWLSTGDMGYIDSDGFIFITGRIKEKYKLENGKYVVPSVIEERLKLSPFINNALVWGEDKPFNVAVIAVDMSAVKRYAQTASITLAPGKELEEPRIREHILSEIKRSLADIKTYERVRDAVLTAEDFTTENGLLTPSLKVKRRLVMERYGQRLLALYKDAKATPSMPSRGL